MIARVRPLSTRWPTTIDKVLIDGGKGFLARRDSGRLCHLRQKTFRAVQSERTKGVYNYWSAADDGNGNAEERW